MIRFTLHALWQPLAVALAAAAAARLARRLDPRTRAALWLLAILLAALAPVATVLLPAPGVAPAAGFSIRVDVPAQGAGNTWPAWWLGWCVVIAARAIWLGVGLWKIQGLRGGRRILVTDRVAVPVTFGVFRPVIALPPRVWRAGLRRAVLEHERQHIRRRDYAWNLAAEIATLGVWWHPAVWWMKRQWAAEREFACDAAAAQRVPGYAAHLVDAARTLTSPAPRLALGLFDANHFEERIMRLTRPVPFLRGSAARAVTCCVVAILAAAVAFFVVHPVVRAQHDAPVYRVGGDVSAPRLLDKVEPQYTEQAREARIEGKAVLYVVIGADGRIIDAKVLQGVGAGLDEQAVAAIYQWTFEPGRKDGQPVPVSATVEVDFRLL